MDTKCEIYSRYLRYLLTSTLSKTRSQDFRLKGLAITIVANYLHTKIKREGSKEFPEMDAYRYLMGPGKRIIKECKFYITRTPSPDPRAKGPKSVIKKMCHAQVINSYNGCAECDIRMECLMSGTIPPLEIE